MEDTMTKPGLLLMMTDIDPASEADFNRWYEEEHLDERMKIPGFINARRFTALEGGPKYLALYDLESPDVLQAAPYQHVVGVGKSAWTKGMESQFVNFRRNVYVGLSERTRELSAVIPGQCGALAPESTILSVPRRAVCHRECRGYGSRARPCGR